MVQGLPDATAWRVRGGYRASEGILAAPPDCGSEDPEAAEKATQHAMRESTKRGHQMREETLILARYTVILTNCEPDVTVEQLLEAYRFRWQIELAFKRLKRLLYLDALRARDPDLAQTYLLGKILAALVAEDLTVRAGLFPPWGFVLVPTPA